MSHFDEKTQIVSSKTEWGLWYQTIDEVFIEINLPPGTKGKDVACKLTATDIQVAVQDQVYIEGKWFSNVVSEDCVWTVEDRKLLRIICQKSVRDPGKGWKSLTKDKYQADVWTMTEMEKKLTLERFQRENPGFDFSGAEVTGNFADGGPKLPER
ncbi:NudC domain-containing protein 2 [Trichoplax sp. H2]|uniref:CS domain-containing protein n=1 Tax=Trichoplax adhaerens TaxID=10228 RepID=B3SBQ3_TRIAD|nr:hypothetical protein TRIADDRAFT_61697 [Trichoplax adhaerens]EDV19798.1 hypothetical protein TRIADDRAFT_61697 [Trichoplax adhaerens]RDD39304.1 NudC domain-containing protein 2 [Trichoplax sp. H2]|eukprot:XP_002117668.1 hypothetical protein TRIADDRAFT_61697 [Trichoplax adhaerens]